MEQNIKRIRGTKHKENPVNTYEENVVPFYARARVDSYGAFSLYVCPRKALEARNTRHRGPKTRLQGHKQLRQGRAESARGARFGFGGCMEQNIKRIR
jgi:hypothetical protein